MRRPTIPSLILTALVVDCVAGCAARTVNKPVATVGTLAELRKVRPDVQEVKVEQGLEQAMQNYRRYLDESPETALTPEAMRRLADLQLERQFGIRTSTKPREMAVPEPDRAVINSPIDRPDLTAVVAGDGLRESDQDFERRTTAEGGILANSADASPKADADTS